MKRAYDFGGIFGEASKNHDKIPTTNLRSDEMHPIEGGYPFQNLQHQLKQQFNLTNFLTAHVAQFIIT